MDLSPEDKERIYREEKARLEAQERVKRDQAQTNSQVGCLGCLGLIGIMAIVILVAEIMNPTPKISSSSVRPSTTTSSARSTSSTTSSSETRLFVAGSDQVPVAVDEASYNALVDASVSKDNHGILELIAAGKVFSVPNSTKVLILDPGFTKTKVRILEGAHQGKAGFVPAEWAQRR